MSFSLVGRTALVTGAGRGLGRAAALALAEAGADVALVARTTDQVEDVGTVVRALGRRALPLVADVVDPEAPGVTVKAIMDAWGSLDILVYCAGTTLTRSALEVTAAEWRQVIDVNLTASFFWGQAAARVMAGQGGGRIINVASVLGQTGAALVAPYCASKGGLIALTKALAVEWARLGITVNAVAPGYVKTALNEAALEDERVLSHILSRTPLRRLGTAEEVAGAITYLASDAAAFITGHVLAVDGGWLAN